MSPTQAARFGRGVSYVFMLVATLAIVVGYIKLDHNQSAIRDEITARTASECKVITQVKNAVLSVAKPIPEMGVTDPVTLLRIRIANGQRAEARQILSAKLACPRA